MRQYFFLKQGLSKTVLDKNLFNLRIQVSSYIFQDDSGVIENEWRFAAMVLDRVCLIAFTFFTVLLSAAVLIAAPHVIVG